MSVPTGSRFTKPLRILLIDDNPYDLDYIRSLLERVPSAGFTFVAVGRLDSGLTLIASGNYDVVIADLHLPDAAGLTGVKAIRATAPDVPLLVVTGMSEAASGEEAIDAGADGYLEKGNLTVDVFAEALLDALQLKSEKAEA